ncbi:MAG TPA: lipocalin-like domain-containing protein, partial [Rhodothermales bacterium]|nr:lipocalin-like domain-containing protein [Rhodothermales bacterium]
MRFSVLCLLSSVLCAAAGCGAGGDTPVGASLAVAEALAGDTAGYARATAPRPFVWPEDHGPHPDFKTEWWYYTGNLRATDGSGRRFGYQLTVFRTALAPPPVGGAAPDTAASAWATRQLYMAHV